MFCNSNVLIAFYFVHMRLQQHALVHVHSSTYTTAWIVKVHGGIHTKAWLVDVRYSIDKAAVTHKIFTIFFTFFFTRK